MHLNTTILQEISFQLTEGNPWWGMLLANEYIDRAHPLRTAFEMRFAKSIENAAVSRSTLANALLSGKRRSELPKALIGTIGSRSLVARKSIASAKGARTLLFANTPVSRRAPSTTRLALRQRNPQVARFGLSAVFQPARSAKVTHLRPVAL